MASGSNTLLIGMLFIVVLAAGGYFLFKSRKEGTQLDLSAAVTPTVVDQYTAGGGPLVYPTFTGYTEYDIRNYYPDYDWDERNRRYDDDDEREEHHWWEFWKDWDTDDVRTSDRLYMYYWNKFGDELRGFGFSDEDLDEFVRWVTKRNRNEREIRNWINERVEVIRRRYRTYR